MGRLQKGEKLSPQLLSLQLHLCAKQEKMCFSPQLLSLFKDDEEDGLKNEDSFVALGESVASMMEIEAEGVVDIDNRLDDNNQEHCNKKVVNNNGGGNKGLKRNLNGGKGGIEAAPQRGRGKPKKSSGSGSSSNNNNNGNEFYFYSGFWSVVGETTIGFGVK